MAKGQLETHNDGSQTFLFDCPGCGALHAPCVRAGSRYDTRANGLGPVWGWNGSMDAPTFTPSLLVRWNGGRGENRADEVCHSFITDGHIQFLSDCTHELAGQTVDLPDWETS